jgi:hypothetical protein
MRAYTVWLGLSVGLFAVGLGTVSGDDDKPSSASQSKPVETPKASLLPKAPDFAGYQWVTMLTTEVVKADDSKATVRVYWAHAVGGKGGGRGGRSGLGSGRGHHSPFAVRRPNVKIKWEHHDYTIPYHADGLARTKQLPPKIGSDGKRGFYSAKEQDELSAPIGAPGFQAGKADIVPGTIIEAHIIRDRTIAASKLTDSDMRLKYAVILRHDPNPPKDIASPSPSKKN